ncbi:MAG: glycosyltransferase family 9 protein [Gemmatimonadaceae bacterium]
MAALGDAVMASTIVAAVQSRWPGAELTWVAGAPVAELVRTFRGVDRVIEVDDTALLRGNWRERARALVSAWLKIGRGYDVAIVAHTDKRYTLLAAFSGAGEVRRHAAADGSTIVGRWHGATYAELVGTSPAPDYRVADVDLSRLPVVTHGGAGRPTVVVAPGGARNVLRDDPLRRWPLASWRLLTEQLVAAGVHVVIVGGQGDHAEAAACEGAGGENFCGRTSVPELLALVHSVDCVVSHDSGVLHLSILAGAPCVALFGPTRPGDFVPEGTAVTVLSAARGLPCAPCYDGRKYAPCALNRCLQDVTVEQVFEVVMARTGLRPQPPRRT